MRKEESFLEKVIINTNDFEKEICLNEEVGYNIWNNRFSNNFMLDSNGTFVMNFGDNGIGTKEGYITCFSIRISNLDIKDKGSIKLIDNIGNSIDIAEIIKVSISLLKPTDYIGIIKYFNFSVVIQRYDSIITLHLIRTLWGV